MKIWKWHVYFFRNEIPAERLSLFFNPEIPGDRLKLLSAGLAHIRKNPRRKAKQLPFIQAMIPGPGAPVVVNGGEGGNDEAREKTAP